MAAVAKYDDAVEAAFSDTPPAAPAPSTRTYDPAVEAAFAQQPKERGTSEQPDMTDADEARALGGGAEGILHWASGKVANLLSHDPSGGDYPWVRNALTYDPRSQEGKDIVALGGKVGSAMDAPGTYVAAKTGVPELGAATNFAIQQAPFLGVPAARGSSFGPQSVGAASATFPAVAVRGLSPDLAEAATRLDPATINPEVLGRHIEADTLPVKMRLTEGQATQDPDIISHEMNNRGATGLSQVFNEQNTQLKQNISAIRDNVGPDVFTTNHVEHADTLIEAYKAKDAAAQADISAKYQALRDANGGKFPVDAQKLLDTATANLHDKLLFDHAPKAVMSTLDRLANSGAMTFENFESLRTNLARVMRSATDGNERAAAGIIRDAMEQMPLSDSAAKLKPLADTARKAARDQFEALRNDPAYNAAVNDTVPPDRFVSRYIINGNRDDVATMRQNLADNPTAVQTMGVAALDHLRTQAGISPAGEGNFSQAAYNRHLQALTPKALALFDPQTANQLETLGNVARYTQFAPRGNVINTSGTLSGAIAEHAKGTLEGAVNYGFKGVPVGTWTRKVFQQRALQKELESATTPLAGVNAPPKK